MKLVDKAKTVTGESKRTIYKGFFNHSVMTPGQILKHFNFIFDFIEQENQDIECLMDEMCFIILLMERYYRYMYKRIMADKEFTKRFANKIVEMMDQKPSISKVVNVLELVVDKYDAIKEAGFEGPNHLMDNPNIFKLIYQFDLKEGLGASCIFWNEGPWFYGVERYQEEKVGLILECEAIKIKESPQLQEYLTQ